MDVKLGGGLALARSDSPWAVVTTPDGARPVALLVDDAGQRCRLGLAVLGGDRVVDVSRDPAAFFNALRRAADSVGEPRERWASAAASGLDRLGREAGWWEERRTGEAEHTALAAAWPLLRRTDLGTLDPTVLPRWVAGLCAGPELRPAVRRQIGRRGSRRVTRLIGEHLAGRPTWWPLALVLAMPRLDAAQTGELLAGLDDHFCCTDEQFAVLGKALSEARPDLAVRLLQSASREADPQRLLSGLDGVARARELIPRLPTTVSALELCVAESLATPPPPSAATRPSGHRRQRAENRQPRPPRNALAPNPAVVRAAAPPEPAPEPPRTVVPRRPPQPGPPQPGPPTLTSWKSTGRFDHPPEWQHLDGATRGDVRLRLPLHPADLNRWGFELDNCLGSYRTRVDSGRSLILGIFVNRQLGGAVEVDPAKRRIVQISSTKNRPLARATRETVTAMLLSSGAVARA